MACYLCIFNCHSLNLAYPFAIGRVLLSPDRGYTVAIAETITSFTHGDPYLDLATFILLSAASAARFAVEDIFLCIPGGSFGVLSTFKYPDCTATSVRHAPGLESRFGTGKKVQRHQTKPTQN
jgi:hypothetical protein